MIPNQKPAPERKVKITELNVAVSSENAGKTCSKLLKDEYETVNDLTADLNKHAEKLLKESAAVYIDGRQVFPIDEAGFIIDTGAIFDEENGVWLKSAVGASSYTTDPVTKKLSR